MLKILLFLVQTALDDGSTGQESLLQASEGFVLNLNSSFFFEGLYVVETALFEDRKERIVDLLLGCVILFILLALLHLVTSLSIDRLLQDSNEDVLGVLRTTLLINCLLAFISQHELCLHLSLLTVGLCVAGHLQFVILLFNLLLLGLFLVLLPICLTILVCCRSIVVATVLVPCRRCLLRRGPKGAVGQLILSEVFAHLVKSIDCPKSKLGYLNPAIVHRLSVHNYYDKMKTILLKRGCKTRTSSRRDTCLYSIEALAE